MLMKKIFLIVTVMSFLFSNSVYSLPEDSLNSLRVPLPSLSNTSKLNSMLRVNLTGSSERHKALQIKSMIEKIPIPKLFIRPRTDTDDYIKADFSAIHGAYIAIKQEKYYEAYKHIKKGLLYNYSKSDAKLAIAILEILSYYYGADSPRGIEINTILIRLKENKKAELVELLLDLMFPKETETETKVKDLVYKLLYPENYYDWREQGRIVQLICELRDPRTIDAIKSQLYRHTFDSREEDWEFSTTDYDGFVITNLILALKEIGNIDAKNALDSLLIRKDRRVATCAKRALIEIDPHFYYSRQKEKILSVVFAGELTALLHCLEDKSYKRSELDKIIGRLENSNINLDDVEKCIRNTGDIESWEKELERMRENEMQILVQEENRYPAQIFSAIYRFPQADYRNFVLFSNHINSQLGRILNETIDFLTSKNLEFLKQERLDFKKERTLPPWADADDHSWENETDSQDLVANIRGAIIDIIKSGIRNAVDACFESIQDTGNESTVALDISYTENHLTVSISDEGKGIEHETMKNLVTGCPFESPKSKIIPERDMAYREEIILQRATREVEVRHDLEVANEYFKLNRMQIGGKGIDIQQSATLAVAYDGILEIDTYNINDRRLILTYGESGFIENMIDNPIANLASIPMGVIKTGNRLRQGTTFTLKVPLRNLSVFNNITNIGENSSILATNL